MKNLKMIRIKKVLLNKRKNLKYNKEIKMLRNYLSKIICWMKVQLMKY